MAESKNETIIVDTEYTLDLTTIFEDEDNDNLAYYAKVGSGDYTPVASSYTYKPNSVGTTTHIFKVNDGVSYSADTYTINLDATASNNTIPNRINTVSATTNASIQLGETYTIDLDTIFEDLDGDSLSYTLVENGNSSKLANSLYRLRPNKLGINNLSFYASDALSSSIDRYSVDLIVNPAPINNPPNIRAGVEHVKVTDHIVSAPYTIDLSATFEDIDGDPLTYYKAKLFGNPIEISEVYTFTVNELGTNTFGFTAFDGEDYSSNGYTLSLNVVLEEDYNFKPNRRPTVPATSSQSITFGNSYNLDLSTIFEDSDNDTLSYKVSINGASEIRTSENYSITPTKKGITNLRFVANDGSEDSEDTYFVELISTSNSTSGGKASSSVEEDTTTLIEKKYRNPIPSTYLGVDKVFETKQEDVKVKINGKSLDDYKDRNVELLIQEVDLSNLSPDIDGELLEASAIFDISLVIDGLKVPFESDEPIIVEIEVDTDLEEHKVVAVYIDENGEMQIMDGVLVDGVMRFTTNHLSNYTLMYVDKSFADVESHWAQEAIEAIAARGVVSGIGGNLFNPNGEITRAEFTTIMVRYFSLASHSKDNYSDIGVDKWYTDYVSIAKANGILPDIYKDTFGPNKAITREEMMYILYKSLEVTNKLDTLADNGDRLSDFSDSNMLSNYAIEGSEYLISRDVINGNGKGMLSPGNTSLRAEVAQMLYNMLWLKNITH